MSLAISRKVWVGIAQGSHGDSLVFLTTPGQCRLGVPGRKSAKHGGVPEQSLFMTGDGRRREDDPLGIKGRQGVSERLVGGGAVAQGQGRRATVPGLSWNRRLESPSFRHPARNHRVRPAGSAPSWSVVRGGSPTPGSAVSGSIVRKRPRRV